MARGPSGGSIVVEVQFIEVHSAGPYGPVEQQDREDDKNGWRDKQSEERGIREWQLYEWKKRLRREEEAQFLAAELKRSERDQSDRKLLKPQSTIGLEECVFAPSGTVIEPLTHLLQFGHAECL